VGVADALMLILLQAVNRTYPAVGGMTLPSLPMTSISRR
jgi:hypothetical protein